MVYDIDPAVLACIDEDGEIIDVEAFEALQIERNVKIDNAACAYKNVSSEADGIKAVIKTLKERLEAKENHLERIKVFLSLTLNGEKFETPRNKISFRASESVNIFDENALPAGYIREKTLREADKISIKEAIKQGQEVPGAELVSRNNIQIK